MTKKVPSKNRRLVLNSTKAVAHKYADKVYRSVSEGNGHVSYWDTAYDACIKGYEHAMREARKKGVPKHG